MDTSGNIRDLMPEEEKNRLMKQFEEKLKNDPLKIVKLETKRIELEMAMVPRDNEIPIDKLADPNCKDCYGRGHIKRIIENIREIEPCHCVKPPPQERER